MQKCTHREVRILLGGFARLVGFLRTALGFKVANLPPKTDWLEVKFSFRVDYYMDGVARPVPGGSPLAGDSEPGQAVLRPRKVRDIRL